MTAPIDRDDAPRPSHIPRVDQRPRTGAPSGSRDGGGRGDARGAGSGSRGGDDWRADRRAEERRRGESGDRADPLRGLPDPVASPGFYADVPSKRLIAFLADSLIIGGLTVILIPFTAFTALFYLPFLAMLVGLVYRTLTLASGSATWGMRMVAIELRTRRGERFDLLTAAGHTLLFTLFLGMVVPLLISVALMLTTPRGQGLHDMILGTAALNRPARR